MVIVPPKKNAPACQMSSTLSWWNCEIPAYRKGSLLLFFWVAPSRQTFGDATPQTLIGPGFACTPTPLRNRWPTYPFTKGWALRWTQPRTKANFTHSVSIPKLFAADKNRERSQMITRIYKRTKANDKRRKLWQQKCHNISKTKIWRQSRMWTAPSLSSVQMTHLQDPALAKVVWLLEQTPCLHL